MLYLLTLCYVCYGGSSSDWTMLEWFCIITVHLLLMLALHVITCFVVYEVEQTEDVFDLVRIPDNDKYIKNNGGSIRVITKTGNDVYQFVEIIADGRLKVEKGDKNQLIVTHRRLAPTRLSRVLWFDKIICIVQLLVKETTYLIKLA